MLAEERKDHGDEVAQNASTRTHTMSGKSLFNALIACLGLGFALNLWSCGMKLLQSNSGTVGRFSPTAQPLLQRLQDSHERSFGQSSAISERIGERKAKTHMSFLLTLVASFVGPLVTTFTSLRTIASNL